MTAEAISVWVTITSSAPSSVPGTLKAPKKGDEEEGKGQEDLYKWMKEKANRRVTSPRWRHRWFLTSLPQQEEQLTTIHGQGAAERILKKETKPNKQKSQKISKATKLSIFYFWIILMVYYGQVWLFQSLYPWLVDDELMTTKVQLTSGGFALCPSGEWGWGRGRLDPRERMLHYGLNSGEAIDM